jgi:hypothetical protein
MNMHAHPPFKERAAQRCMQNEKTTSFVRPFSKAQILGAFTTPSLVAACYPLAVGGERGCE